MNLYFNMIYLTYLYFNLSFGFADPTTQHNIIYTLHWDTHFWSVKVIMLVQRSWMNYATVNLPNRIWSKSKNWPIVCLYDLYRGSSLPGSWSADLCFYFNSHKLGIPENSFHLLYADPATLNQHNHICNSEMSILV